MRVINRPHASALADTTLVPLTWDRAVPGAIVVYTNDKIRGMGAPIGARATVYGCSRSQWSHEKLVDVEWHPGYGHAQGDGGYALEQFSIAAVSQLGLFREEGA